jgi:MFS family permease
MSQQISLREAERKVFRTAYDDGLWDVFLGSFLLLFAIAPLLTPILGDLWSSVVFLPLWVAVFAVIRLIRKRVVAPRVGVVRFGRARRTRLRRFTVIMLGLNSAMLIFGFVVAPNFGKVPGQMLAFAIGAMFLVGFSIAAYFLDFSRFYIYGLLAGLAPLIGEWLWAHGYAANHGFPITFGATAAIMILVGLAVFIRLLRDNPVPSETVPPEEA